MREAHDLGADPAKPTERLEQAKHAAEQATLAREGLEQRVNRAGAERETYLAANGQALLAELEPDCDEVVRDLCAHAEALLLADKRWRQLSAAVSGHLRAQRLIPHANAPGEHGLEPVIADLKRALQHDIASPSPHMSARDAADTERERVAHMLRARTAA